MSFNAEGYNEILRAKGFAATHKKANYAKASVSLFRRNHLI
jgi:hypothetical protein